MYFELRNDFHNTIARLRVPREDVEAGRFHISASQVKRAEKALCGMAECTCSGPLGVRGWISDPLERVDEEGHPLHWEADVSASYWTTCGATFELY